MNTVDIFERGVTPKEGEDAGKRFKVVRIERDGVVVKDEKGMNVTFKDGSYNLWSEPRDLFDSRDDVTWGRLKSAMEARGLSDDTCFFIHHGGVFGLIEPAAATVRKINGKKAVILY